MNKKRIMVVARDAGAAGHIAAIVKGLEASHDFLVQTFASDAAARFFSEHGIRFTAVENAPPYTPDPPRESVEDLRIEVLKRMNDFRPQMVLSGLSNYAGGIDDMALEVASTLPWKCLRFYLADSAGLNHVKNPQYILTTNRQIYAWAQQSFTCHMYWVGYLKKALLASMPVDAIREKKRREMGLSERDKLCVFIAQSSDIPGHDENFEHFLQALTSQDERRQPKIVIRSHPSFPETAKKYFSLAEMRGVNAELNLEGSIYELLCAADGILTSTSTVPHDYLCLSLGGKTLRAVVAYLLIGRDIQDYLMNKRGGWQPNVINDAQALRGIRKTKNLSKVISAMFEASEDKKRCFPDKVGDDLVERCLNLFRSIYEKSAAPILPT